MPGPAAIRLSPADNVAVARRVLLPGQTLDGVDAAGEVILREKIPALHKVALERIPDGHEVRRYGQPIGVARGDIAAGSHVHSHNLVLGPSARAHEFGVDARPLPPLAPGHERTFNGYARPGGRAGTRNYLAVISSVNCSASVSRYVADHFRSPAVRREFPEVDGVMAFTHKSGCAMSPDEPTRLLQRVLAGIARHPNITGYVLVGLGCEVNQTAFLLKNEHLDDATAGEIPAAVLNIQTQGGVQRTVDAAVQAVSRLLPSANALRRTPQPLSRLVLALNCGGSDGASGITANPALGVASDLLVRHGATTVLAETPEIYGAEHLLTRRAVRPEVGQQIVELIRWWEDHVRRHGATIDNNPSVGNKEGGLTTIFEKSLGAVAKGGQAPLAAVYRYAETIRGPGFCFMDTPGYDPVSMTGLVAGGCNVAVFTTGRGSVYGCKPAPSLKVSTNTPLYDWMRDDMDLNAGTILDGGETVEQVGARLFEAILATASGERTKSEMAGLGDEEFAPWILGPVL
ncbi:MAG: altronate dehydratase [Verrucomicrobiales bacterium]|nr:altronate dehydratase [Verrucomicrobiales bacterium]